MCMRVPLQASGKGGRGFGHVFFAEFSTSDDDELRLITGGVGHVKFWILNGRSGSKCSLAVLCIDIQTFS